MEEEKVLAVEHILIYVFKFFAFTLLCGLCIYVFMQGLKDVGLLLFLLLLYLILEERLKAGLVGLDEDFAAFILLLAGWQAGSLLGWLIEEGRFFPEAAAAAMVMLLIFYVSWRLGKMFEKVRREAERMGLIGKKEAPCYGCF